MPYCIVQILITTGNKDTHILVTLEKCVKTLDLFMSNAADVTYELSSPVRLSHAFRISEWR